MVESTNQIVAKNIPEVRYGTENKLINMINFRKLNITKGLDEWIALHELMAPKMLAVGMQFRFAVANPVEDTLFLLIEMNGDI